MWRGQKSLVCDPGSELRLGGREKRRAKILNGINQKTKQKTIDCTSFCDYYVGRCRKVTVKKVLLSTELLLHHYSVSILVASIAEARVISGLHSSHISLHHCTSAGWCLSTTREDHSGCWTEDTLFNTLYKKIIMNHDAVNVFLVGG